MIRFADPQGVHSYAWPSLGRQNSEQLEHDRCFNRHFFAWIALFLHILALVIQFLLIEYLQVYQVCMFLNALRIQIWFYIIYICVCVLLLTRTFLQTYILNADGQKWNIGSQAEASDLGTPDQNEACDLSLVLLAFPFLLLTPSALNFAMVWCMRCLL